MCYRQPFKSSWIFVAKTAGVGFPDSSIGGQPLCAKSVGEMLTAQQREAGVI